MGVWYTATPLLNNPPVQEETKVYGSTTQTTRQPPPLETNLLTRLRNYTVPLEPPLNLCILPNTCQTPSYFEFKLENILVANPLASTRETETIRRKGKWFVRPPRLFKDKYNYLPAYFVSMNLPLTPHPNCPMEPITTAKTTSTQLFGVLYITLTEFVDSMVPKLEPWSLLGQSLSRIIKLAPIL
ncbi:hypothetical protein DSO57_1006867 [Entomophthora muscae]|uniref:Uncharacterized protein n=1 Tax=Entomophthora muscae TaxID=34485 RepID=A0ACC2SKD5_9FUNG|nr:hypothetical protein DSO57_1006867 [Entomophthora muscae]